MLRPRALCHLWNVLLPACGFVPMSPQGLYSVMPCLAHITKLSYTLSAMGYVYLSIMTIQGKLRLSSYSQRENEQVLFKQCVSLRPDRAESWTNPSPLNNSFYYIYFLSVFATDDCKLNPKIQSCSLVSVNKERTWLGSSHKTLNEFELSSQTMWMWEFFSRVGILNVEIF